MSRIVRFALTAVLIAAALVVLVLALTDPTVAVPQFATRP